MTDVRLAVVGDLESIRECVRAAYEMYLPRMDCEPAPMLADYRSLVEQGTVHVIRDAGEVCGVIVTMLDDDGLFVENVAVHPDHQGRGLGRTLMAFAEARARDLGAGAVHLYTNEVMTENLTIYEHLGFTVTRRGSEAGYARVFMRKQLA